MCDGELLVEDDCVRGLDLERLRAEAQEEVRAMVGGR
jgi:hypothetical protein